MLEQLKRRLGDAEHRRDKAGAAIPAAILDRDEDRLAGLREERREAATESGDLAEAAGQIDASRLETAEAVDAALAGLETAVADYEPNECDNKILNFLIFFLRILKVCKKRLISGLKRQLWQFKYRF